MTVRTWTPEQGCQDLTVRTELPGQDCQDKTARKDNQNGQTEGERERGQAERDTQNWTGRTGLPGGQPGQEPRFSQERRARKRMLDHDIKYWKTGMEQAEQGGRGVAGPGWVKDLNWAVDSKHGASEDGSSRLCTKRYHSK
jgi:hypothetical protein